MYADQIAAALTEKGLATGTRPAPGGAGHQVDLPDGRALIVRNDGAAIRWAIYSATGRRGAISWVPHRSMFTPGNLVGLLGI